MFDGIVLAGGTARRLDGVDKAALAVGGHSLLERAVAALDAARVLVVVGPRRPVRRENPASREIVWCREEPVGGGPVAAIAAGLPHIGAGVVLVLAADLPWICPAVPVLVDALHAMPTAGVAVLADGSGRRNHLAAAWRREVLQCALAGLGDPNGVAVSALVDAAAPVVVTDTAGWGVDCDTWTQVAAARRRAEQEVAR